MSSEIVKIFQSNSLAVPEEALKKYNQLAETIAGQSSNPALSECAAEWRPTQLKLVHPVTSDPAKPENAKTGDYFYPGGILQRPNKMLIAYAYTTRVRFVQDVDRAPSCRSEKVDTKGRGENDKSVSVYGDSCAKCPHHDQPFREGKSTNCNNQLNFLLIPEDLSNFYTISFAKSAWSVASRTVDMMRATPKPWSRFYSLNSENKKRDGGAGLYAVPVISPLADTVPEHLQAFASFVCDEFSKLRAVARETILRRSDDVQKTLDALIQSDAGVTASVRDTM